MKSVGSRYMFFSTLVAIKFGLFVACGSQLYQVSMKEDIPPSVESSQASMPASAPSYGIHSPDGWGDGRLVQFKVGLKLNEDQRNGLFRAMRKWQAAVGKQLFDYLGEDITYGDSFPQLYDSLSDNVNGNYLNNDWTKTKKSEQVLATTIWENYPYRASQIYTSDIRFNGHYYLIGNAYTLRNQGDGREVVDMETLALHELGHLLGLAHVAEEVDPYSIMLPKLFIGEGQANRLLTEGDIERIQKIYGCEETACDRKETESLIASMDDEATGDAKDSSDALIAH